MANIMDWLRKFKDQVIYFAEEIICHRFLQRKNKEENDIGNYQYDNPYINLVSINVLDGATGIYDSETTTNTAETRLNETYTELPILDAITKRIPSKRPRSIANEGIFVQTDSFIFRPRACYLELKWHEEWAERIENGFAFLLPFRYSN
uniref:Uncharacterized protein n=1 Tax=Strigamia maritima TaxID=126957 RepID=T1ITQ3_STRMM